MSGGFGIQPIMRSRRFAAALDRKSTRLNSSHVRTSYAVFCLKKKNDNLVRILSIDEPDEVAQPQLDGVTGGRGAPQREKLAAATGSYRVVIAAGSTEVAKPAR